MSGHFSEVAGGVVKLGILLCRLQDPLGLREEMGIGGGGGWGVGEERRREGME